MERGLEILPDEADPVAERARNQRGGGQQHQRCVARVWRIPTSGGGLPSPVPGITARSATTSGSLDLGHGLPQQIVGDGEVEQRVARHWPGTLSLTRASGIGWTPAARPSSEPLKAVGPGRSRAATRWPRGPLRPRSPPSGAWPGRPRPLRVGFDLDGPTGSSCSRLSPSPSASTASSAAPAEAASPERRRVAGTPRIEVRTSTQSGNPVPAPPRVTPVGRAPPEPADGDHLHATEHVPGHRLDHRPGQIAGSVGRAQAHEAGPRRRPATTGRGPRRATGPRSPRWRRVGWPRPEWPARRESARAIAPARPGTTLQPRVRPRAATPRRPPV